MTTPSVREAAAALRAAQRRYMEARNQPAEHRADLAAREAAGAAVAAAAAMLDLALAEPDHVAAAARKLYMAGRWTAGLPTPLEARMWTDLRDALGLEPGTATAAGVHDPLPPHGCPRCDDAMECDCEPPLPFGGGQ